MLKTFRNNLANLITGKNSMSLPNQFLRYGNRNGSMYPEWQNVVMSDEDHYTGYGYAAITNRAATTARVAKEYVKSDTGDDNNSDAVHPYLDLIRNSKTFSENDFWEQISTYLDLEGVYFLMAVRALGGPVQEFQLLNPYHVRRIVDPTDPRKVGGYVEVIDGYEREIPKEMIIEIREFNPFKKYIPLAMTDAARDSAYTIKTAGDFTRHALKNNTNAPGVVTTDVILEQEQFDNFVARMKDHTKGEPVYGNGGGAIKWQDMMTDMSKAALPETNEINRDQLFATSGVSKTIMGIEQSGTTRETANVQKDLYIESRIVPRINRVNDALNMDYRVNNPKDKSGILISLDNPIAEDQDMEDGKVTVRTSSFDLFQELVDAGYDEEIASNYVNGEIDTSGLGKPKNPPKPAPLPPTIPGAPVPPKKDPVVKLLKKVVKKNSSLEDLATNAANQGVLDDQQSLLQNTVVNIDQQLVAAAIARVPKIIKNDLQESDLITPTEKKSTYNDLLLALTAFYGVILAFQGKEDAKQRGAQFGLGALFTLDKTSKAGIKQMAQLVANSHIDTISNDLYEVARKAALEGQSQQQVITLLKKKYNQGITEVSAKAVARTETNRAFTMAQFDADRQFIEQNGLQERAFKVWHTRSEKPCPFCQQLESEGEVPFDDAFRDKGSEVNATVDGKSQTLKVTFATLYAGNAHTNCSCDYELVIKPE